ncbi:hypothetical protein OMC77_001556, partial [Neisseria gonorrhoeae]
CTYGPRPLSSLAACAAEEKRREEKRREEKRREEKRREGFLRAGFIFGSLFGLTG